VVIRGVEQSMTGGTTYDSLIALLEASNAHYRLIDHPPEGRTEVVSTMRGHPVRHAAKCIILIVKNGKRMTRFLLAVVPGDTRVDIAAVKTLMNATYVGFAATDVAERLAGSVAGTVLPFAFDASLTLVVDPALLENREIYFNAARLDRSVVLDTRDYLAIAQPRLARIAAP
jgi:Ala-tRNA(Pro) deacylase